jgi:murein DD-endopeptidase MepM/ murein hydrolase activator NlpD
MNTNWRVAWLLVALAFVIGCTSEDLTPTLTPTSTSRPTSTATPTSTPTPTCTPIIPTPTIQMTGTIFLDEENATIYRYAPGTFIHPLRMVVLNGTAYLVDRGLLISVDLEDPGSWRIVKPSGNAVEGVPIKELGDLALSGKSLLLLDRSGDVYRYFPEDGRWSMERLATMPSAQPRQYLASVASYEDDFYLLDINLGQIWRHQGEKGEVVAQELGLEEAIDLAVDEDLYLLIQEGSQARLVKLSGSAYEVVHNFDPPGLVAPTLLFVRGDYLYVIDDYRRLLLLDKESGEMVRQYYLRGGGEIQVLYAEGDRLYLAGRDAIYAYPGVTTPAWERSPAEAVAPFLPHDPQILKALPSFVFPIEGMRLPDRAFLLPGAPRLYRYGVHEGMDLYLGREEAVTEDTPLLAVADGVVIRADDEYTEPTAEEMEEMLAEAQEAHYTPPEILERLRGRQVWLDLGGGIVVRYCHLSRITEGLEVGQKVKQGTIIGYAGNSGTPQAQVGPEVGVHLHLEVRFGDGYLGQYLRPSEVKEWLPRIFK